MKVYAVIGVPPEIQAYAMAKYSRSDQSMLQSIAELSAHRAERFLETFYFQYGHRSIADLAHLALAVEDISILAASRVVDEPLWDGQERSTRYQPFAKTGYFTPAELTGSDLSRYREACDWLFSAYQALTEDLLGLLQETVRRPDEMDEKRFVRTLRARAFDVSRALLPLSTITSLGQVVSARVLERQIVRLLSDQLPEVQAIANALRRACQEPAVEPFRIQDERDPLRAAPTLVKYTQPSAYLLESRSRLRVLADEVLAPLDPSDRSNVVELAGKESILDEAVATLLYANDSLGHSYRQIQDAVASMSDGLKREVLDHASADRGSHDELLREMRVGYELKFDILMDFGSFRDLHRHRRCVQVVQDLGWDHGFQPAGDVLVSAFGREVASRAVSAGLGDRYDMHLSTALSRAQKLRDLPHVAPYTLPLAARTRALFKMDAAEAIYIIELRTSPSGHFSYRRVAWLMFEALRAHAPDIAGLARPANPEQVIDLLQR